MIKKWLVSIFALTSLFFSAGVSADIFTPTSPNGSVKSDGKTARITFNEYGDSHILAEYKGWGMELSKLRKCVTSRNYRAISKKGYKYIAEDPTNPDNPMKNCMSDRYTAVLGNEPETKNAVKESDFIRGRICGNSDCNQSDPNIRLTSDLEASDIQYTTTPKRCTVADINQGVAEEARRVAKARVSGGECFVRLKRTNFSEVQKYYNTLPAELKEGDVVRTFVYVHNNAQQPVDKNDLRWNANKATNVNVNLAWENGIVTSVIDSDQTNPITDTFQYDLPAGLKLSPKVNSDNQVLLYRNDKKAVLPNPYTSGNSIEIPLDTVYSSYGNLQRLYVDFEVKKEPTTLKFIKEARTSADGTWHKMSDVYAGEVYEYRVTVENTGTSDVTDVKVIDRLNDNLTYVEKGAGAADSVTHNGTNPGGVVSIDFGTVKPGVTNKEEQIFKVKVKADAGNNTVIPNAIVDNKGYCENLPAGSTECDTTHTVKDSANPSSNIKFIKEARTSAKGGWHKMSDVYAGEVYEYRVTVENTGTSDVTDVKVTDRLNDNLTYVEKGAGAADSVTHNGTNPGGVVSIDFGTVKPGVTNKEEQIFKVRVKDPIANGTLIPNAIVDNKGYCENLPAGSTECDTTHTVKDRANPTALDINKQAKTIANNSWHAPGSPVDDEQDGKNGGVYQYKITVVNNSNSEQTNVTVTDTLASQIRYAEFVGFNLSGLHPSNKSSSGVTASQSGQRLEFSLGNMSAGSSKHIVFRVRVVTTAKVDTIRNQASLYLNRLPVKDSNQTVHMLTDKKDPTDPEDPGSSTGVPMLGMCSYDNGAYSCKKVYPDVNNIFDWRIQKFNNCLKDASGNQSRQKICLNNWIREKGIETCSAASDCKPNTYERVCVNSKGRLHVNKSITKVNSKPVSIAVPVTSMGDKIQYKIDLELSPQKFDRVKYERQFQELMKDEDGSVVTDKDGDPIYETKKKEVLATISSVKVRLHDLIVPSYSGFVWGNRNNGLTFKIDGKEIDKSAFKIIKTDRKDHMKIEYTLTPDQVKQFNNGRVKLSFSYELNTALTRGNNTCEITNVAFAVAEVEYKKHDGASIGGKRHSCSSNKSDTLYSQGGSASAKIRILRPYVETKNGNLCAKGNFGTKTKGQSSKDCNKVNEAVKTATINKKIEKIGKASPAKPAIRRLGAFTATADNNGIYFLKGGKGYTWQTNSQHANFALGRSETFIIDGADLVINSNLKVQGPYIPAFIVKGGNIIIGKDVTDIHGVFIALADDSNNGGEIISGKNGTDEAKEQLRVSGNLIGDAKKLFISRRYIGEPNEKNGVVEPAVKIMYDLRVFEQTPPGLNNFLGHDWKQEIE